MAGTTEGGEEGGVTLARLRAAARSFCSHPAGPTILAVALALAAWPIVALTLDAVQAPPTDGSAYAPLQLAATDAGRWTAALGSVLVSALVAGTFGGWWSRRKDEGEVLTILVAWVSAIAASPLLPALLGQNVGFGVICIDSCGVIVRSDNPISGPIAALMFPIPVLYEYKELGTLVVGYAIWLVIVRRFGRRPVPPVLAVPPVPAAAPAAPAPRP